jgi:phosphoglycolate phosphatase
MPKAILFDLDGTLVQTRESSWEVFTRVNQEFGLGVRSQEEYFGLLEGNLFEALRELAGARADEVAQRSLLCSRATTTRRSCRAWWTW